MSQPDHLMDLERGFWSGDHRFFSDHVADQCLLALPGMAGVHDRKTVAASIAGTARWRNLKIAPKGQMRLSGETVIVVYEASADREGEPYRALVSSGYVRRGNDWKLVFHQQTPLATGSSSDPD